MSVPSLKLKQNSEQKVLKNQKAKSLMTEVIYFIPKSKIFIQILFVYIVHNINP